MLVNPMLTTDKWQVCFNNRYNYCHHSESSLTEFAIENIGGTMSENAY